jgi:hypothetical protein
MKLATIKSLRYGSASRQAIESKPFRANQLIYHIFSIATPLRPRLASAARNPFISSEYFQRTVAQATSKKILKINVALVSSASL